MIPQPVRLAGAVALSMLVALFAFLIHGSGQAQHPGNMALEMQFNHAPHSTTLTPATNSAANQMEAIHLEAMKVIMIEIRRDIRQETRQDTRQENRQDVQQAAAAGVAYDQQQDQQQTQQQPAPAVSTNVSTSGFGAFEACVIRQESGGNPRAYNNSSGASGLFGFLLSTWMKTPEGPSYPNGAYTAPASVQEQAFAWAYANWGTSPWAPYDGC